MSDPFKIEGPALISFSGGRTSGYMLWRILQAHGGTLPHDVHVCFANTGKEREETLRFVHECATRWGVRVRWLEHRSRPNGKESRATPHRSRFDEVGYNSAVIVGLINYPRFPSDPDALLGVARQIADDLMHGLHQHSYAIQTPTETHWFSRRTV